MTQADGDASDSSDFIDEFARDVTDDKAVDHDAAAKVDVDADDSSDENPFNRPFTGGVPAEANLMPSTQRHSVPMSGAPEAQTNETQRLNSGGSHGSVHDPADGVDLGKRFAELEEAERLRARVDEEHPDEQRPLKKHRREHRAAEAAQTEMLKPPQDNSEMVAHSEASSGPKNRIPPTEKVMEALAVLRLPITYDVKLVEKSARKLAFKTHPDKVKASQRWQAEQQFRKIQNAKGIVLSWLRNGSACQDDDDESEVSLVGVESDGEDSWGDAAARGYASDEVSDERVDEMRAAGIRPRSASRSPSSRSRSDEFEMDDYRIVASGAGQPLSSENRYGVGSERSAINVISRQARALQKNSGERVCPECYEAKLHREEKVCSKCRKELQQLKNLISG